MAGKDEIQEIKECLCGDPEKYKEIHQVPEIPEIMQGNYNNPKLL